MAIDSGAIVLNRFLSGERTLPAELASAKTAADFANWLAPIVRNNWMVDCQGPPVHCLDSTAALKYLARYVAGVAFHDERILLADEQGCVLRVKDYRHDTVRTLRLTPDEFVSRFTLHLLPRQLRRMRYAGMFHAGAAKKKLPLCRQLLLEQHAPAASSPVGAACRAAPAACANAFSSEPTTEELRETRESYQNWSVGGERRTSDGISWRSCTSVSERRGSRRRSRAHFVRVNRSKARSTAWTRSWRGSRSTPSHPTNRTSEVVLAACHHRCSRSGITRLKRRSSSRPVGRSARAASKPRRHGSW